MDKLILALVLAVILALGAYLFLGDSPVGATAKPSPAASAKRSTIVGVVMNGPATDDGWGSAHSNAFDSIREELNLAVIYKENTAYDDSAVQAIREVVEAGATIVFATSFNFGDAVMQAAPDYPDVTFFHCSGTRQAANVSTYMGRMYQMRYLSGIAAGLQTETNELGFVAAMPIDEVIRGINAFTLGARSVNPAVKVHVAWTGTWLDFTREYGVAHELLGAHPIDVIAYHQDSEGVIRTAAEKGVTAIGYNVDKSLLFPRIALTSPMWNWATFYRREIRAVLDGTYRSGNYWDGAETGIVTLAPLAPFAKPGIRQAVDAGMKRLLDGGWDVFHGPLRDNKGETRVPAGAKMSDSELLNSFDWFVDGVVDEGR